MVRLLLYTTTLATVLRASLCSSSVMASSTSADQSALQNALQAVDFEVYGKVQGVFFRKHTKAQADRLGLRGWCLNTSKGTVQGHIEGPNDKVETMMKWLTTTGSPSSKIDKAEFNNMKKIQDYTQTSFDIRKDV